MVGDKAVYVRRCSIYYTGRSRPYRDYERDGIIRAWLLSEIIADIPILARLNDLTECRPSLLPYRYSTLTSA